MKGSAIKLKIKSTIKKNIAIKKKNTKRYRMKTRKTRKQIGGSIFKLDFNNAIMVDGVFDFTPENVKKNTLNEEQSIKKVYELIELFKGRGMPANVGSMYGCYCPPHRGHYENILRVIKELDLRILFLHTGNRYNTYKSRHGIPADVSVEHLCIFARHICSMSGGKVIFFITADEMSTISWNIESNVDRFYEIGTYEFSDDEESMRKAIEYKEEKEREDPLRRATKKYLKNFERSTEERKQDKVKNKVFFRTDYSLSSSRFTKCLIELKNKIASGIEETGELYKDCYYYIPDFYTDEMKLNYIRSMLQYKDTLKTKDMDA